MHFISSVHSIHRPTSIPVASRECRQSKNIPSHITDDEYCIICHTPSHTNVK